MNNRLRQQIRFISAFFIVLGGIGIVQNSLIEFDLNYLIASIFLVLLFSLLLLYANKTRISQQDPETFLQEIQNQKSKIERGGWVYHGMKITSETEVSQYYLTISIIFFSVKVASRFYIIGSENTKVINGTYSLVTFLLGWWGIPWGPIYTIQSLVSNLRGGNRIKVAELLVYS